MENSVEALLIAFAVIIFVVALTVSFTTIEHAKSTADVVLYFSDREKFQSYVKADPDESSDGGRTVKMETVLATLSRCIKENFAIEIKEGTEVKVFDYAIQNKDDLKAEIEQFINTHINNTDDEYRETYAEIIYTGKVYSEDGINLEEDVGKKIYIYYNKI